LNHLIHHLLSLAASHPQMLELIVFVSAVAEAVIVVGALFPGTAVILAASGLAGVVNVSLWQLVLWATAGAAVGDGASYWIGHHYGSSLARRWPFALRPQILERGTAFFDRHGGKSVFTGRFVPGVKAVVPAIAGMSGMPLPRFLAANLSSAVIWSAIHVVPAAAAGVLLATIGAVSGRLLAALVAGFVAIIVAFWLARLPVLRAGPWVASGYRAAVVRLAHSRNGLLRRIARAGDPRDPRLVGAVGWSALFALAAVGFAGVVEDLVAGEPIVRADAAISRLVQSVRTPLLDRMMIGITEFGDAVVVTAVVATLLASLALARQWRSALVVGGAFILAAATVPLIKLVLHRQRPIDLYSGAELFSFPSGHSTFATLLFATLALLIAPQFQRSGQIAVWTAALLGVIAVGTSRVYLGAHWPSDVIGGILVGTLISSPLALLLAYKAQAASAGPWCALAAVAVLLGSGIVHGRMAGPTDVARYVQPATLTVVTESDWRSSGWAALPMRRVDLLGEAEEPFFLQYGGTPQQVANVLTKEGWRAAEDSRLRVFLKLLSPVAALASVPPWPLLHDGEWPILTLIKTAGNVDQRLVFRLWPSAFVVKTARGKEPILLGSVTREFVTHPYRMLTAMFDEPAPQGVVSAISAALTGSLTFTAELRARHLEPDILLVGTSTGAGISGVANQQ
jgi:membrane protein DedA with SNARE-associated domain/membrane-associated phospholipid phosphatase